MGWREWGANWPRMAKLFWNFLILCTHEWLSINCTVCEVSGLGVYCHCIRLPWLFSVHATHHLRGSNRSLTTEHHPPFFANCGGAFARANCGGVSAQRQYNKSSNGPSPLLTPIGTFHSYPKPSGGKRKSTQRLAAHLCQVCSTKMNQIKGLFTGGY